MDILHSSFASSGVRRTALALMSLAAITAMADNVAINNTNFPDAVFKNYVSSKIDTNKDGYLSESEIANAKTIELKYTNMTSLKGIEYLTALEKLDCAYNKLTSIDVSQNTKLKTLYCYENNISEINITGTTALEDIQCGRNKLTSLDVSTNTALKLLLCGNNQITSLDVRNNTALSEIVIYSNKLTSIDVSNNKALTWISCDNNQLSALDVSQNTALTRLDCSNNKLVKLDLGNSPDLERVYCTDNKRTLAFDMDGISVEGLDMTKVTAVSGATVVEGKLVPTSKKVTTIEYTYSTQCQSCQTVTFTLNKLPVIVTDIDATNFPDEKFRNYVLANIDSDKDNKLSEDEIWATTSIDVFNYEIASLEGIGYFTDLASLDCSYNNLTTIDVSHNTMLTKLECYENSLSALDVSKNTKLTELRCNNNQLTALDLSNNTALTNIDCEDNQLTELDLSNNTALTDIDCEGNQLSALDLRNNTELNVLDCSSNQLTALDLGNNPLLEFLYCSNNHLTMLDLDSIQLIDFECEDNERNMGKVDFSGFSVEGLDMTKVSNVSGATVDNGKFVPSSDAVTKITYTYDTQCSIESEAKKTFKLVIEKATTTAVEAPAAEKAVKAYKTVENGEIVIVKGGERFNLAGRKIE